MQNYDNYSNYSSYDNYIEEESLDLSDMQDNIELDSEKVLFGLEI